MSATVFLIDSNRLFREGLKRLLQGSAFSVTGEASSMEEGISFLTSSGGQPAIVLLDAQTVSERDINALRALAPQTRVVMLSPDFSTQRLSDALRAGVHGYLVKDIACESLIQSLQLVLLGEKVFPTNLAAMLLPGAARGGIMTAATDSKGLSRREMQILRCLLHGNSNKMIANHLGITEATIKVHLKSLLRKINASNRTQAAIWAMNNGIAAEAPELLAV